MFSPESEYTVVQEKAYIKDFFDYSEEYVVRPPYQRKNVWRKGKKQALLDSLFRRYYVPRIVLREIRLGPDEVKKEVIDGQQRINTVQEFFADQLPLPNSLEDVREDLPGKTFSELSVDVKKFVGRQLAFDIDYVKQIDETKNTKHQRIATEIFWRLQQGESLNLMEVAHARLNSTCRNFVVKYADDIGFNYDTYEPIDENSAKHPFFDIIERNNNRMQHLALLTRFLILEEEGGAADIQDGEVAKFIDKFQADDGIGNVTDFEARNNSKEVLRTLDVFHKVFKNDPVLDENSGIRELSTEYFIVSLYLLLRHLRKYYVIEQEQLEIIRTFTYAWHDRWRSRHENDTITQSFVANRQQSRGEIEKRNRIIRQLFFEYCDDKAISIIAKDSQRAFSEAQRIKIYRENSGFCQICLKNGRTEDEAAVSWSEFEADHVLPHSKGGNTVIQNGQVLCSYHNQAKGSSIR